MARHLIDYNPITGESVHMDYKDGDSITITHTQDANVILDSATELRNNADYSRRGIKNDHWHYARVPNAVALEMKTKHGVDMLTGKTDWKSVLKCINTHYPWLKVTDKTHA